MNRLMRRLKLILACGLLLPMLAMAEWQPAEGAALHFSILEGSNPVGELRLEFARDGDAVILRRHQNFAIKRMLLKASMEQTITERWTGDELERLNSTAALRSSLKDEDQTLSVSRSVDGQLHGHANKNPLSIADGTRPLSFWRASQVRDGRYFDLTSGKLLQVAVVPEAVHEAPPAGTDGGCIATRIAVVDADKNKSQLILWFDPAGALCAMRVLTGIGDFDYAPIRDAARRVGAVVRVDGQGQQSGQGR